MVSHDSGTVLPRHHGDVAVPVGAGNHRAVVGEGVEERFAEEGGVVLFDLVEEGFAVAVVDGPYLQFKKRT